MTDFPCTQCGLCCKNLRHALTWEHPDWLKPAIAAFPKDWVLDDGSCAKMVGNQCSVYEDRPLLCNLERGAEEMDMPMDKDEWFELNVRGCHSLQARARNNLRMEIRQWLHP